MEGIEKEVETMEIEDKREGMKDYVEPEKPAETVSVSSEGEGTGVEAVPTHFDFSGEDEIDDDDDEEEEEVGVVDEEEEEEEGPAKKNLNVVFIGHVDAGKSTISGQIMWLTGNVDERTMEKYERESKAKNREGWKFAWVIDTNEEEREKGKTVECGQAIFETDTKRFTILDAPGHKAFVPHMIGGASQADIAVLVISARSGEFEAGFVRDGQTMEHAILAKTAGIRQLIVVVNKIDDETVNFSEERYNSIIKKLLPFFKSIGFNPKTDVTFLPVSGIKGLNLKDRFEEGVCPWYRGPCLFEVLENVKPPTRLFEGPVRFPITDKYRDMGCVVLGKVESGVIHVGDKLLVMPTRHVVEVTSVMLESHRLKVAEPGDNIRVRLKGIEEDEVHVGFVMCSIDNPVPRVTRFEASLKILDAKSILAAGYQCMLHIHTIIEECTIVQLVAIVGKNKEIAKKKPKFVNNGDTCIVRIEVEHPICVEPFKKMDRLGRFMLRDEGRTVGIGIIERVAKEK